MKLFLFDQTGKLGKHLEALKSQPIIPYDKSSLPEKTSSIQMTTDKSLQALQSQILANYKIFPSHIMTYLTQWYHESREMRAGDTIVQQVYLPPVQSFSQKLIFGVRIFEIINESDRVGFSYETIEGHVERGISTFTLEKTTPNRIIFKIRTFSQPEILLSRVMGPVFAVPYQEYCTRQALKNVKELAE